MNERKPLGISLEDKLSQPEQPSRISVTPFDDTVSPPCSGKHSLQIFSEIDRSLPSSKVAPALVLLLVYDRPERSSPQPRKSGDIFWEEGEPLVV